MESQRTAEELWQLIDSEFKLRIPRPAYDTWFHDARPERLTGGTLSVSLPNEFLQEHVEKTYTSLFQWAIAYLDLDVEIQFSSRTKAPKESVAPVVDISSERSFGDLKRHELIRWLSSWGFSWSHRLLRDYPQDLVVELLDGMIGSPDSDRAKDIKPAWFVGELKVLAEERQHLSDVEEHTAQIVPFEQWHRSA